MTKDQELLRTALEQIRNLKEQTPRPNEWVYTSPEQFVLEHGEWWDYEPLPLEYEFGAPRTCFANAIVLCVLHPELTYVEGYGMMIDIGLPIHHAWNVDPDGRVIDSTWRAIYDDTNERVPIPGGAAYCGVRFSFGRADDACWEGDAAILDDWKRGWPILREPWQGEDWAREWPNPSPLIRIVSAAKGGV